MKTLKEFLKHPKEISEDKAPLDVTTSSAEDIAKKHGVSVDEIKQQIEIGAKIEHEHTKDQAAAEEIARDHLNEKPDYYKKLKKYVESVEQIDELDKKTYGSYIKSATKDASAARSLSKDFEIAAKRAKKQNMKDANAKLARKFQDAAIKRHAGISKAVDRLTKEEVEQIDEKAPPGFEGTVKAMKKHKEIDNPYALAWYLKNKGAKSHYKASGVKKEEVEQLKDHVSEELKGKQHKIDKNKNNKIDGQDFAILRGQKKVKEEAELEEGIENRSQQALARSLRGKPAPAGTYAARKQKDDKTPPFEGPYTNTPDNIKDKSGAVHTPLSRVKHLAHMAMQQKMKEKSK